jgi:hypothetical protein
VWKLECAPLEARCTTATVTVRDAARLKRLD